MGPIDISFTNLPLCRPIDYCVRTTFRPHPPIGSNYPPINDTCLFGLREQCRENNILWNPVSFVYFERQSVTNIHLYRFRFKECLLWVYNLIYILQLSLSCYEWCCVMIDRDIRWFHYIYYACSTDKMPVILFSSLYFYIHILTIQCTYS